MRKCLPLDETRQNALTLDRPFSEDKAELLIGKQGGKWDFSLPLKFALESTSVLRRLFCVLRS